MGITYTGRFSTITGLRHAAPSTAVSTALTPTAGWIGSAKSASVNGDLYAVAYQAHSANDGSNNPQFSARIDIYQTDGAGTVASKIITFGASNATTNFIPGFVEFSPNGVYLAFSVNKTGDTTNSGIYIFERTAPDTWTQVRFLQNARNNFSWHGNSTTYYYQNVNTFIVGDMLLPSAYQIPVGQEGIRGNVQTAYGTAWFGDTLLIPIIDNYEGSELRFTLFAKAVDPEDVTVAQAHASLNLNEGLPNNTYSKIVKISESRFVIAYSSNSQGIPALRDFNVVGADVTPRLSAANMPQANNATYNFATYSQAKSRLMLGNGLRTLMFKDVSGAWSYIPSETFKARKGPISAGHHTSGDLIFTDNYDVTTYSLPASGGFKNPVNKQTANSVVFSWDFNNQIGSTDFSPTINTSFNNPPVTTIGTPAYAAAPGHAGQTALRFTTAGSDKILMAKDRDWQFLYDGFTIELWLYFSGKTDGGMVIGDSRAWNISGVSAGTGNQFRFRLGNSSFETVNINNVTANTWNHIAVTGSSDKNEEYSSMSLRSFTNGYPGNTATYKFGGVSTVPFFPNYLNFGYVSIGGAINPDTGEQPTSNNGFAGYIRGVKIYNYPKTYTGIPYTLPPF